MNRNRIKRLVTMLRLFVTADGLKKSAIVKKSGLFAMYGENNYWFPRILPAECNLVRIHNNVHIASDVYFCTHDVMQRMFENDKSLKELLGQTVSFKYKTGEIEIFDNVFLGAKSVVMYDVKIGPNAIIAAGSVITKDVPEGAVVGGNPARVIGSYYDIAKKRGLINED